MNILLRKLQEKTTWAGLFAIISAFGITIKPELTQEIATIGASLSGLALILFNEKKK